jgi:hypothetical protein
MEKYKKVVSTKELFHFTKSIENLKSIIDQEFAVQYSVEDLVLSEGEEYKRWAFPMICFCDIPLNLVQNHIQIYGGFGIGINRQAANVAMKLNPVIYIDESELKVYLNKIKNYLKSTDGLFVLETEINNLNKYLKKYKGDYDRIGCELIKDYIYYNEREWRYTPPIELTGKSYILENEFGSIGERNETLHKFNAYIYVEITDIEYLIVKTEKEKAEMDVFMKTKDKDFDSKKIIIL